jgi:hypothetical protein
VGYDTSILLYTAPIGGTFVARLPADSKGRRSIRRNGGFWQFSRTLYGSEATLFDWFTTWLGCHLVERSGSAITWEGMVYELEIEIAGERRRRSLDDMKNAVSTTYQSAGVVAETAYATQAQSIARYRRSEDRLLLDNYPLATAQAYRDTVLAERGWPWPRPQGRTAPGPARLDVRACGYVFTGNWLFVEEGDGTDDDVDDWMAEIVGSVVGLSSNHGGAVAGAGDCQFLKTGSLSANTLQVTKLAETPVRAWDVIQELAQLGDANGDPWSAWVDVGQVVHYQKADLTPRYFLRQGVLYDTPGGRDAVNPFAVRPAVVRNMDYPARAVEPGSMLADARDSLVDEVEVDEAGVITLRPAGLSEADVLAAQYAEYERPEE